MKFFHPSETIDYHRYYIIHLFFIFILSDFQYLNQTLACSNLRYIYPGRCCTTRLDKFNDDHSSEKCRITSIAITIHKLSTRAGWTRFRTSFYIIFNENMIWYIFLSKGIHSNYFILKVYLMMGNLIKFSFRSVFLIILFESSTSQMRKRFKYYMFKITNTIENCVYLKSCDSLSPLNSQWNWGCLTYFSHLFFTLLVNFTESHLKCLCSRIIQWNQNKT